MFKRITADSSDLQGAVCFCAFKMYIILHVPVPAVSSLQEQRSLHFPHRAYIHLTCPQSNLRAIEKRFHTLMPLTGLSIHTCP